MNKILILIINYSNEDEVLNYVKLISEQDLSDNIEIAIVNNKSINIDYLNEQIKKINIKCELFDPNDNLGYLGGVLYGYEEFIKKSSNLPEWVVISNTDIDINDKQFFNKLVDKTYSEDIVCIAPSVFSPATQSYQNPHYKERISSLKINMLIGINSIYPLAYLYENLAIMKTKLLEKNKPKSCYVYSAHGCFFILKNNFISKISKNGYKGFMYSEESYIAENILKYEKKCFYDSELEVIHNENAVTGLLGIKKRSKYIANSLRFIKNEFYTNY